MLGFAAELIGELAQGGKGPLGQLGAYQRQCLGMKLPLFCFSSVPPTLPCINVLSVHGLTCKRGIADDTTAECCH